MIDSFGTSALRLYAPDTQGPGDSGDTPSPAWTLSQFWHRWVQRYLLDLGDSPRTAREYSRSVEYWVAATGDPPLDRIEPDEEPGRNTRIFVRFLVTRDPQLSPNTIRKHCRQIQRIFNLAGPRSAEHRGALRLIRDVPFFDQPKERRREPQDWSLDELERLLRAAREAPQRAAEWETLVVLLYNTGLRIGTARRLHWAWIGADGWCAYPGTHSKTKDPKQVYVNRVTRGALNRLQRRGPLVFPALGVLSESQLHRLRRGLVEVAGVRPGGFHAIRKSHAAQVARFSWDVARSQLGHMGFGSDVTAKHYVPKSVIADVLEKLPQPTRPLQRSLF